MKALILAAGRGARMGVLTERQHKCQSVVNGKTLLDWQLQALRGAGVDQIAIVRGHLSAALTPSGCYFYENPIWDRSNMVRSLLYADQWWDDGPSVVSYADIVYGPAIVQALVAAPDTGISMVYDPHWLKLWSLRFADPLSDAETFRVDEQGLVVEIGRRPTSLSQVQGQYMGLLKISQRGFAAIKNFLAQKDNSQIDRMDMTSLLRSLIEGGEKISAVPVHHKWYEVDNLADLELYNRLAQAQPNEFLSAH